MITSEYPRAYGKLEIPLQHVTDKTAINQAIDKMNPNDPPSYMPDLIAAETALLQSDAKIKHVIILGDGDATVIKNKFSK